MKTLITIFGLCLAWGLLFAVPCQAAEKPELKIHGELEYEFSSGTADDVHPQFQPDKFVIKPKVKFGDFLEMSAQWYCRPTMKSSTGKGGKDNHKHTYKQQKSYLNECHIKFKGLPARSYLDFGLYERAIKDHHSRKTETYSLYGNAFYRDDSLSIAWGNWKKKHKAPPFYWLVSVSEGFKVGHKQPAEQTSNYDGSNKDKLIQDDLDTKNNLKYPELGFNLGINQKFKEAKVDVMGFYYTDKMSKTERTDFEEYLSDDQKGKLKERDRSRVGGQVNVKIGPRRIFAGFLAAKDAGLERTAYVVEVSHKFKLEGREIFKSITPVVSYSGYTIDGEPEFDKAESWDRTQIILAVIIEVLKGVKIKAEYIINDEETGGTGEDPSEIDNNEVLVQLEVKF
jgi:hypothetical protein